MLLRTFMFGHCGKILPKKPLRKAAAIKKQGGDVEEPSGCTRGAHIYHSIHHPFQTLPISPPLPIDKELRKLRIPDLVSLGYHAMEPRHERQAYHGYIGITPAFI